MTNNKHGRTFWDWVTECPKTAIFLVLVLGLGLLSIIFMNKPIKIGPIELNQTKEFVHDTLTQVKSETTFVTIPSNQIEPIKAPNSSEKNILITKGNDTLISVKNQPTNINTGTNNGIIGNDNKINVNSIPREFDQFQKNLLLKSLKDKNAEIDISSVAGDQEAFSFANKIMEFLKSNGYSKVIGVSQSIYSQPMIGQFLTPTKDGIEIIIGSKPAY